VSARDEMSELARSVSRADTGWLQVRVVSSIRRLA
jgi:hypothetical protein